MSSINGLMSAPCFVPTPSSINFDIFCQFNYHSKPYICDPSGLLFFFILFQLVRCTGKNLNSFSVTWKEAWGEDRNTNEFCGTSGSITCLFPSSNKNRTYEDSRDFNRITLPLDDSALYD